MAIEIIETVIGQKTIRIRIADSPQQETATETIDLAVTLGPHLSLPSHSGEIPLGNIHTRQLASIQLAALRYVQDVITGETRRLLSLSRT